MANSRLIFLVLALCANLPSISAGQETATPIKLPTSRHAEPLVPDAASLKIKIGPKTDEGISPHLPSFVVEGVALDHTALIRAIARNHPPATAMPPIARAILVEADASQSYDMIRGVAEAQIAAETCVYILLACEGNRAVEIRSPTMEEQLFGSPGYRLSLIQAESDEGSSRLASETSWQVGLSTISRNWSLLAQTLRDLFSAEEPQRPNWISIDVGPGVPLKRALEALDLARDAGFSVRYSSLDRGQVPATNLWWGHRLSRLAGAPDLVRVEEPDIALVTATQIKSRQTRWKRSRRDGQSERRDAVTRALAWIGNQQSDDGSWINGGAADRVWPTSAAMLALQSSGASHKFGVNRRALRHGVRWFREVVDAEGRINGFNTPLASQIWGSYALLLDYSNTSSIQLKRIQEASLAQSIERLTVRPIIEPQRAPLQELLLLGLAKSFAQIDIESALSNLDLLLIEGEVTDTEKLALKIGLSLLEGTSSQEILESPLDGPSEPRSKLARATTSLKRNWSPLAHANSTRGSSKPGWRAWMPSSSRCNWRTVLGRRRMKQALSSVQSAPPSSCRWRSDFRRPSPSAAHCSIADLIQPRSIPSRLRASAEAVSAWVPGGGA